MSFCVNKIQNLKNLLSKILLTVLLLQSCAYKSKENQKIVKASVGTTTYLLQDASGEYVVQKTKKYIGHKIISKVEVYPSLRPDLLVEKTIAVSVVGTTKFKNNRINSIKPEVSQHTIWLDKKKYFSQLKTIDSKKILLVSLESPEEKWKGDHEYKFPKGAAFCYFSQIEECVLSLGYVGGKQVNKNLFIIWDNFPYNTEQLSNMSENPIQPALWKSEKSNQGRRYSLNLGNQSIFFHFNNKNEFETMYWIAQGIVMKKK